MGSDFIRDGEKSGLIDEKRAGNLRYFVRIN